MQLKCNSNGIELQCIGDGQWPAAGVLHIYIYIYMRGSFYFVLVPEKPCGAHTYSTLYYIYIYILCFVFFMWFICLFLLKTCAIPHHKMFKIQYRINKPNIYIYIDKRNIDDIGANRSVPNHVLMSLCFIGTAYHILYYSFASSIASTKTCYLMHAAPGRGLPERKNNNKTKQNKTK